MISILYLHHVSSIGGGSYCLLNILKNVDRKKYIPIVLLKSPGPLVGELNKLGIEFHYFPQMAAIPYNRTLYKLSSIKAYCNIFQSLGYFEKIIEKLDIKVVYLNSMMLYPYLKVAKKKGMKTIIHIREHWPLNEHKMQLLWAQTTVNHFADAVVAINNYSASMFPRAADKTSIVYDWIDFSDRYEYILYDDIFGEDCSNLKIFLYSGGIQRIKGADIVLDTFVKHMKNPNYRLLLVGIDPKIDIRGFKGKIKSLLSRLGYRSFEYIIKDYIKADNRVKCFPATYKLKHLMQQAYCHISFYTIPHANLALAENVVLNTVSIAVTTPESIEYSNNGELAILIKFNDKNDFLQKLNEIESSYPIIKKRLAEHSYIIEKMFDREVNTSRLADIYKKVVSK